MADKKSNTMELDAILAESRTRRTGSPAPSNAPKRNGANPRQSAPRPTAPRRNLNEDVSFESFEYDDAEPSPMQRFFLTHKEINVAEFARSMGMNPTLLRNYINGFKKPSKVQEQKIIDHIHKLGAEMLGA